MVITVVAMRVMKAAVDQIIDVIAVRYGLVSAPRTVHMTRLMVTAVRRTFVRIFRADLDLVFIDMIAVRVMQVAIMEIIYMVAMLDCGVTAVRAMLVVMVSMMGFVAGAHAYLLCSRDRKRGTKEQLFTVYRGKVGNTRARRQSVIPYDKRNSPIAPLPKYSSGCPSAHVNSCDGHIYIVGVDRNLSPLPRCSAPFTCCRCRNRRMLALATKRCDWFHASR
ncbi:hypothetical protein WS93_35200 [Burkholderia cepacia]|nr:hypothetical protein WS93_35200 [Burkholderia cepacia]